MNEFPHTYFFDPKPRGPLVRVASLFSKGVREVQSQIIPYANSWNIQNVQELNHTGPTWVALGDSMTQGIGASAFNRGWVGQLRDEFSQQGFEYNVVNLSISGARIRDVLDRQLPMMRRLGLKPELLTLMIGSNDYVSPTFRVAMPQNYRDLLSNLPEGTVVANMMGSQGMIRQVNSIIQEFARDKELIIADMSRHMRGPWHGMLAPDRFHPNDVGYGAIAKVFDIAISKTKHARSA